MTDTVWTDIGALDAIPRRGARGAHAAGLRRGVPHWR